MRARFLIACKGRLQIKVTGVVFGDWGIADRRGPNGFVITHIPSGRAALVCETRPRAVAVAKRLKREVPMDSFPDSPPTEYEAPLLDESALLAIRRIMADFNVGISSGDAW